MSSNRLKGILFGQLLIFHQHWWQWHWQLHHFQTVGSSDVDLMQMILFLKNEIFLYFWELTDDTLEVSAVNDSSTTMCLQPSSITGQTDDNVLLSLWKSPAKWNLVEQDENVCLGKETPTSSFSGWEIQHGINLKQRSLFWLVNSRADCCSRRELKHFPLSQHPGFCSYKINKPD